MSSLNSDVYPKWWGENKGDFKVTKQQKKKLKQQEMKEMQSQSYVNPSNQYDMNNYYSNNMNPHSQTLVKISFFYFRTLIK